MKIFSNFKDFYDSNLVYNDSHVTFQRFKKTDEIKVKQNELFKVDFDNLGSFCEPRLSDIYWINNHFLKHGHKIAFGLIFFCEKPYPFLKIKDKLNKITFVYGYQSFIRQYENEKICFDRYSYEFTLKIIKWFFDQNFELKENYHDIFNSPYFLYEFKFERDKKTQNFEHHNIEINICLKDYQFFKVIDSQQAYQEIDFYIGNFLNNKNKEIIKISDKSKIKKYGFDPVYGFRKKPKK